MTQKEFAEEMANAKYIGDTEYIHIEMDAIMCKLLESLGYTEGVKIFKETRKWYS